jgi:hypothetical protein
MADILRDLKKYTSKKSFLLLRITYGNQEESGYFGCFREQVLKIINIIT